MIQQRLSNLFQQLLTTKNRLKLGQIKLQIHNHLAEGANNQLFELGLKKTQGSPHLKFIVQQFFNKWSRQESSSDIEVMVKMLNGCENIYSGLRKENIKMIDEMMFNYGIRKKQYRNMVLEGAQQDPDKCLILLQLLANFLQKKNQQKEALTVDITQFIILSGIAVKNYQTISNSILQIAIKVLCQSCCLIPNLLSSICQSISQELIPVFQKIQHKGQILKLVAIFMSNINLTHLINHVVSYFRQNIQSMILNDSPEIKNNYSLWFGASQLILANYRYWQGKNTTEQIYWCKIGYQLLKRYQQLHIFKNIIQIIGKILHSEITTLEKLTFIDYKCLAKLLVKGCTAIYQQVSVVQQIKWVLRRCLQNGETERILNEINITIQSQFEQVYNEDELESACNMLCYLGDKLNKKSIEYLKSLMNLSESVDGNRKKILMRKIIDFIVSSNTLWQQNQFMKQVMENLVIDNYPNTSLHFKIMEQNGLLSERGARRLQKHLFNQSLTLEDRINVWKICLKYNKAYIPDTEMSITIKLQRNIAGRRIYNHQWIVDQDQLTAITNLIQSYPQQYSQESTIIKQLN